MYKYILFILISLSFSQIEREGYPNYFDTLSDRNTQIISTDNRIIVDRDFNPMVFQFGDEYQLDIDILQSVEPLYQNGIYTFLLDIRSEGAYGIGVIFDDFYMSDNSTLFMYDNERTMFTGSFTSANNKDSYIFPTSPVKGDHIILELNVPEEELAITRLNIGTVIHDYQDIMGYFSDSSQSTREDCNTNVACPESEGFEDQINGAIRVSMGGGLCSASVVNNTANDRTPYVLFADHCVSGSASGYVFYFNYQASTCNGTSGSQNQTISGSTLLASADINSGPDFALLRLTSDIPDSYNPYYVGWSKVSSSPQESVGIHHPGGGIKKITKEGSNVNANGYFWEFQYNDGRVIPGSSGSPFFDQNKRQVGIASYIYTNYCNPSPDCYCDQQYNHGYGRFDLSWDLGLRQYLDPLNLGVDFIDGIGISGINLAHTPLEDMDFESSSLSISAEVSAYTGFIDGVELHYNLGDGWTSMEMNQNFGNNYEGVLQGLYDGMIIQYYILAVNSEGIIEYYPSNGPDNPISFTLGDLASLYYSGFEENESDWIVGDSSDDASAGIWERAIPNGTVYEGQQVQPSQDNSEQGEYCYVTGNAVSGDSVGFDDIDNGKTTLYSPIFDLSNIDAAVVSYWYWYSNNMGDNPGNDLWQVRVSNDAGINWEDMQITSSTANEWNKERFILTDYIDLTDSVQFQFIAEDSYYNGDNGTGGSLVEAALDDFLIEYTSSGIIGDINSDGVVNILDAVVVINMALGLQNPDSSADLNLDGVINVLDIVLLVDIILSN